MRYTYRALEQGHSPEVFGKRLHGRPVRGPAQQRAFAALLFVRVAFRCSLAGKHVDKLTRVALVTRGLSTQQGMALPFRGEGQARGAEQR